MKNTRHNENEFLSNQSDKQGSKGFSNYSTQKKYQELGEEGRSAKQVQNLQTQYRQLKQQAENIKEKVSILLENKVKNCFKLLEERQCAVISSEGQLRDLLVSEIEEMEAGRGGDQSNIDEEVVNRGEEDHLAALTHIYMGEFNTIARQLEFILSDSQDILPTHTRQQQVQSLIQKRQLDGYKAKLCSFYISSDLQQINQVKEKEILDYGGFTPLLKLTGEEMHYDNAAWVHPSCVTPFQPFLPNLFDNCIVRDEFYTKPTQFIKLEVVDPLSGQVRSTLLRKSNNRALAEDFAQDSMQVLQYVEGCRNPLELVLGHDYVNVRVMQPYWRLNGVYQKEQGKSIRVRLGSFFSRKKTHYQKDAQGNECSLDCVGLGITDDISYHKDMSKRSAGIRMWNDDSSLKDLDGQLCAQMNIYAK